MLDTKLLQTLRLSLINMEFCRLDHSWHYNNVMGPTSRLYLITAGEGYVYHHHQKYILSAGKMHLVPAFTLSSYHCDSFLEQYYVHFFNEMDGWMEIFVDQECEYQIDAIPQDYVLFQRLMELNPNKALPDYDPKKYEKHRHLVQYLQPVQNQNAADFLESNGILQQLLSRFLRGPGQPPDDEKTRQLRRLRNILRYINDHLREKIPLEQLAHMIFLNPDYFSRLFTKIIGVRPVEYINRKRIEKAQLLLLTTQDSQEKIAWDVGFSDLSYFCRQFKKYTNMSPGRYRRHQFSYFLS